MSNILDIGASGLLATRAALEVTGDNIANADTEGYHRRVTVTGEMTGAQSSPFHRGQDTSGVRVTDIRRAFDGLVAARMRDATAGAQAAQAAQPYLEAAEQRMMPEGGGIGPALSGFFEAFSTVGVAPDDAGLRSVVLEAGRGLAAGVRDLALALDELAGGARNEADLQVTRANDILSDLSRLQEDLLRGVAAGSPNPILDRRDALLEELSGLVAVHVIPSDDGSVEVSLGRLPGGPLLLRGTEAAELSMPQPGRISVTPFEAGLAVQTRRSESGALDGLSQAIGALGALRSSVDAWAQRLSAEINSLHEAGARPDGTPGEALFVARGWQAEPAAANGGRIGADVEITDAALMPAGPLSLVRDATANLWRLYDGAAEIGNGAEEITVPGLSLRPGGDAQDGDRLMLTLRQGNAADLSFMPAEVGELALAEMPAAPGIPPSGDGRIAERLADLAAPVDDNGQGGYSAQYAGILAGVGASVAAGRDRIASSEALLNSVQLAEARISGVNLDQEASNLMRHQQAYQANAQVISVAREIFDTLLRAI